MEKKVVSVSVVPVLPFLCKTVTNTSVESKVWVYTSFYLALLIEELAFLSSPPDGVWVLSCLSPPCFHAHLCFVSYICAALCCCYDNTADLTWAAGLFLPFQPSAMGTFGPLFPLCQPKACFMLDHFLSFLSLQFEYNILDYLLEPAKILFSFKGIVTVVRLRVVATFHNQAHCHRICVTTETFSTFQNPELNIFCLILSPKAI